MNGRSLLVLLALSLSPVIAACGDDDSAQKSSVLRLDGTYRPTQNGAIASVTFSNDKDYVLVPTGCNASDCVDRGTYRLDAATSTVTLENAVTHRERTITLENVKTGHAAGLIVGSSVGTRDGELVSRQNETAKTGQDLTGDQQQLTDGQKQLTDGQKQLIEKAQKLLETITEAAMNGQGMKQDDEGGQQDDQQQQQQDDQQQQQNEQQNDQQNDDQEP